MSKRLDQLRDQVAALCEGEQIPEPGEFLASLMSGRDPRNRPALLYNVVNKIAMDRGPLSPPDVDEWEMICDLVLNSGLYQTEPVPLETSVKAAEKLMDFLHAKLKAVELTADIEVTTKVIPLTDEEIERFKDIWARQY